MRATAWGIEDVASRGEFHVAMPIMVNTTLRSPGAENAPGLMILLPKDGADPIAIYSAVSKGMKSKDPADRAIVKELHDERYVPHKRFQIPPSWTNGAEVYGVGLMIERSSLRNGVVDDPFLPVLAAPGDKGGIVTLPWQLVEDALRG